MSTNHTHIPDIVIANGVAETEHCPQITLSTALDECIAASAPDDVNPPPSCTIEAHPDILPRKPPNDDASASYNGTQNSTDNQQNTCYEHESSTTFPKRRIIRSFNIDFDDPFDLPLPDAEDGYAASTANHINETLYLTRTSATYHVTSSSDDDDRSNAHNNKVGCGSKIVSIQKPQSLLGHHSKSRQATKHPLERRKTVDVADLRMIGSKYGGDKQLMSTPTVRINKACQKRIEKCQEDILLHQALSTVEALNDDGYATPLQRKEGEAKELRLLLKDAAAKIDQREMQIKNAKFNKHSELNNIAAKKAVIISDLREELSILKGNYDALYSKQVESLNKIEHLEQRIQKRLSEIEVKDQQHRDMYLKMYHKGRDARNIETRILLEQTGDSLGNETLVKEVLHKLEAVQVETQKWQSVRSASCYRDELETDEDATYRLRFLENSLYHYITSESDTVTSCNLQAMANIFGFDENQRKLFTTFARHKFNRSQL